MFKSEQKAKPGSPVKSEGEYLGVSYTTGAITAGVTRREYFNDETTAAAKKEIQETHYGLTYAVNPAVSVNAVYGKVDASDKAARPNDQKIQMIQVGYNLGPVALVAGFAKNEDIGGVKGNDSDVFMTRLLTAF
jgi:predicted porin